MNPRGHQRQPKAVKSDVGPHGRAGQETPGFHCTQDTSPIWVDSVADAAEPEPEVV